MKKLPVFLSVTLLSVLFVPACLKKAFDQPPDSRYDDPKLTITHTIAQFKALNGLYNPATGGDTTLINDDIIISGIVIADDRSGNFYKQLVLDDGTGGLFINIDAYSLYSNYPVGRRIYIKCKGLYLGYNGGTMELGASLTGQMNVNGITGSQINTQIIKGPIGNTVKDTVVTLAAVKSMGATTANRSLVGRLVTITGVQFADTNVSYTDPASTTNRAITDCGGSSATLVVRSSNYANFHALQVAKGHGTITGIYTLYQSVSFTPQLVIRDTGDIKMNDPRCGTMPTTAGISIDSLRKLYPGAGTFNLPAVKVSGTVISDLSKGNAATGNFILEDGSKKGIILYVSGGSYSLGDSLVIDADGGKLQMYNGAMELSGVAASKISKAGTGKTVPPVPVTLAQLNTNFAPYESVLVKVVNATITGGGSYSGNKTLTDGTGSFSLYTAAAATFANMPVPVTPKTFTGIGTPFTTNEIKLRDPAIDVY